MFFDAFGRLAFGQIQQSYTTTTANPPGVAGVGVAGVIRGSDEKAVVGVAGVGVAGSIGASPAELIIGVSGVGVAGTISDSESKTFSGVTGTGVAGSISGATMVFKPITGVAGIGVTGSMVPSGYTGTINGVSGIGSTGELVGPGVPFSGNTFGALAFGQISLPHGGRVYPVVGATVYGVAGIGVAGIVVAGLSGGSGSSPGDADRPRRRGKNERTGFEPVKKTSKPKKPWRDDDELELPPAKPKPPRPPKPLPPEILGLTQTKFPDLAQVLLLRQMQDEQDAQDIADVLALLEMID